jgi:hypothetical protein
MIEAIVISFMVGLAALHVAFKLSPKLVQRKMYDVMAIGLNKIGFDAMAQRLLATPHAVDKACGSGCDGCGTEAAGDELKTDGGAKVVHFHPRFR